MTIVFIGLCHDHYHAWRLLESGYFKHFGHSQNASLSGILALPAFRGELGRITSWPLTVKLGRRLP